MQVSQSYGVRRPLEIAAKIAALRARFAPAILPAPVATEAPALALVPAAPPQAAWVAPMQAERAQLRADLPVLRAALIEAALYSDFEGYHGPTPNEIDAMQARLDYLEDALIFEADAAPTFDALPVAA